MGGDEFVLLLTGLTEPAQAQRLAELADAALRRVFHVRGRTLAISASLGVVMARPGQTAEELLHDADRAMYRHKQLATGGGRSV